MINYILVEPAIFSLLVQRGESRTPSQKLIAAPNPKIAVEENNRRAEITFPKSSLFQLFLHIQCPPNWITSNIPCCMEHCICMLSIMSISKYRETRPVFHINHTESQTRRPQSLESHFSAFSLAFSRSAITFFLYSTQSSDRGNPSVGTFFPRNLQSGSQP